MDRPPERIETDRLILRRWHPADAAQLAPVLDANVAHLKPWIPWAVAAPGTVPELEARLAGYAARFDAGQEWTYAVLDRKRAALLGGVGLYPRDAERRVPFAEADRIEVGYWLRADAAGRGYATEAVRAVIEAALHLGVTRIEMRIDPANAPSLGVPRRLGFRHTGTEPDATMVWTRPPLGA